MPSKKSGARLTEYLCATDNPEASEPAARTHAVDGRNVWSPDAYDALDDDPREYRVECEACGGVYPSWQQATAHAEREHPAERERTSILVYKDELETLHRAQRRVERIEDDDLALHTTLTMICESFLAACENEQTDD